MPTALLVSAACALLVLFATGCGSSTSTRASVYHPGAQTPAPADGGGSSGQGPLSSATGLAKAPRGDVIRVDISVGKPEPFAHFSDPAVVGCKQQIEDSGSTSERSVVVPIRLTIEVKSSLATEVTVNLNDLKTVMDGGSVTLPAVLPLWGATYSNAGSECRQPVNDSGAGSVHWGADIASPHSRQAWNAFLVLPGAITPNDPTGEALVAPLVIIPTVLLGGENAPLEWSHPAGDHVVQCSANDPAAGGAPYLAIEPASARQHGCALMDGNQSASGQAANRLCAEQYPDAASRSEGNTINHNRQSSLLEVCDGFGAPEGLVLSPSMKCALVAASATFAGAGAAATAIENGPCLGADIADAYGKKDWLGPAKGAACNYFGEVFAGGVGVVAAGAASGTGPGAAAVGVITYRALAGGLKIACGGLLDGGARDLGAKLEANYEMHVATDIVHRGKCLRYDNSAKIKKWTAVRCAS